MTVALSVIAPICYGCSRLREGDETCDAYPTGIPDAILGNEVDHRLPYAGDHGLSFAPVEPWAADYAVDVFGPGPAVPAQMVPVLGFSNGVVTVAYSPTQPRRSDGKFGTGGGGSVAPAAADGKTTDAGFQPGGKGGGVSGVLNVPEMSVEEATTRMQAAVPGMRVYQIEQMDPRLRHATTVAVETMAKKFPEATHSADLGQPLPRGIYVMGPTEAREKANIRNLAGNGALAANGNIVFNKSKVGLNGGLEETEAYAMATSVGSSSPYLLPWASVSKLQTKMNSIEGTVAHEWGHIVDSQVFGRMASDATLPAGSRYAERNHAERWAEGFTEWAGGLDTPAAQWVGKRLADKGIVTR